MEATQSVPRPSPEVAGFHTGRMVPMVPGRGRVLRVSVWSHAKTLPLAAVSLFRPQSRLTVEIKCLL